MRRAWPLILGALAACGEQGVPPIDAGLTPIADSGTPSVDAGTDGGRASDAGADAGTLAADAGQRDAGDCPPTPAYNLVTNSSFECQSQASRAVWSVSSGTGAVVANAHSGSSAMQVTTDASGLAVIGQSVVSETTTATYCARVFMRGTVSEMRFEVLASPSGKATAFSSPVLGTGGWVGVPPGNVMRATNALGETLSVAARAQNAGPAQTLVVDDFELWPSPSGLCDEH